MGIDMHMYTHVHIDIHIRMYTDARAHTQTHTPPINTMDATKAKQCVANVLLMCC
jgi:hypothetical protein